MLPSSGSEDPKINKRNVTKSRERIGTKENYTYYTPYSVSP
jgi:hypothetical protein